MRVADPEKTRKSPNSRSPVINDPESNGDEDPKNLSRFFCLFWKTSCCVSDGDSATGGPGEAKNMGFDPSTPRFKSLLCLLQLCDSGKVAQLLCAWFIIVPASQAACED